jgi:outer membrane biosynthesis protein TonB
MPSGDDVNLPDLQVIQRYSLAVRGSTAPRTDVVSALQADLAWLTSDGSRRRTTSVAEPIPPDVEVGVTEPGTAPVKKAAVQAPRKTPAPKPPAKQSAARKAAPPKPAAKKAAVKKAAVKQAAAPSRAPAKKAVPTKTPAAKKKAAKRATPKRARWA